MGGKIQGFLGAVLLVTSVAYFKSKDFKDNQEYISKTLRDTQRIIDQEPQEKKDTPRAVEFKYRPSIRQTVADIWDDSVLSGVKWVYTVDVEHSLSRAIEGVQDLATKLTSK